MDRKYFKHFRQALDKRIAMDIKAEINRNRGGNLGSLALIIFLILFGFSTAEAATCTCTYAISPASQSFSSNGGTDSISVTTQSGCSWTVTQTTPYVPPLDWVSITSGSSGTGSGVVTYAVPFNDTGQPRKGTITIANKTFTIRQATSVFNDVTDPTYWAYDSIYAIYTEGITVGCGNNDFCPYDEVTRGQMAAFIIRALYGENFNYTTTPYFTDVPSTNGFFKYVQKLKDAGITAVSGTYGVDGYVTRGQMAAFIIRALYGENFNYTTTPYFTDVPSTNGFFKYVQKMKDEGITAVTGVYNVDGMLAREQMAAFISRAFLVSVSEVTLPPCPSTCSYTLPPARVVRPPATTGPVSLKVVGQIGGPVRAVAVQDNYAYVGVGLRMVVIDVSNPADVREVGATAPFEWHVEDVAVSGTTAYVGAGGFLYILDISSPAHPTVLGVYETPGYVEGVAISGRYAYLANGPAGLRILDVADPVHPVEVGSAYGLNYVFDVVVKGQFVYLAAAGAGLLVVDISDPAHAREAGSLDTPGYAYGLAVSGNTAYIADGWEGLRVVDVSDPKQPSEVASYDTPGWAMDVVAEGARLYIADAFGGLRVVDASQRAKPTELGTYEIANGDAQSLAASGGLVFVADRNLGLHLVDVSTPAQPRRVGLYGPVGFADGVAVTGKYAYVAADFYGLRVVDLSDDRSKPQEIAAFNGPTNAQVVVVAGDFAYVNSFDHRILYVVDISNPAHPRGSSYQILLESVRNMVVDGDILVEANEWGLRLIDISAPLSPCEINFMNFTGAGQECPPLGGPVATGVAIAGNIAYVSAGQGGLLTIDISDPRHPTMLGVYDKPIGGAKGVSFEDIVLAGNFAYVIDRDTLRVVDISEPRQPKGIGSYQMAAPTGGMGPFLAVAWGRVFVADGVAGLVAVDVSDPANPKLAGWWRVPGGASAVVADDNYIYVAAQEGGLFILQHTADSGSYENPTTAQPRMTSPNQGFSLPIGVVSQRDAEPSLVPKQANLAKRKGSLQDIRAGLAGISDFFHPQGEERTTSSANSWTVSSAADSGPGTLRWALEQARSGDIITFDPEVFPPKSPTTIRLTTALSGINQGSLTIDGSNAGVVLDGSETPPGTNGLFIASDDNMIKGLQILGFPGDGVVIAQAQNTIGGDRSRGTGPLGEGNVISGNKGSGLTLQGGGNKIIGNYIGLDASGSRILSNGDSGITFHARGNVVGGTAPADRNVISGNTISDVHVVSPGGNIIMGNYIGTDASGRIRLSNTSYWSVALEGGSANNRVEGNVIVGGLQAGVLIWDHGSSYNQVIGNYIGLDATGTMALGNAGVWLSQRFNRIEGNVINGYVGVSTHMAEPTDNLILGNFLGTDATGTRAIGSGSISLGGQHNFVGGTAEGERNIVAGQVQLSVGSDYNFIAGNYIGTDASGTVVLPNFAWISLEGAEYNVIQGNLISSAGIKLGARANFNWIRVNRITKNSNFGIEVAEAEGNLIVGNSFINNARNASDGGQANRWDDGKEGNYWDDYTGRDDNGDGIGDVPYAVPPNGVDNYPLMEPTTASRAY